MIKKDGKQIGGMFLSPNMIEDPALAIPYLKANVEMGYVSIIILVRHQRRTVLDRRVHDAVGEIVRLGHELGLKVMLDTDHCWWGAEFVERHPEAATWVIVPVEASVLAGKFEFRANVPSVPGQTLFEELAAVFELHKGVYRRIAPARVTAKAMPFSHPRTGIVVQGQIKGLSSAELVFYVAMKNYGTADVAHPQYLQAQNDILDAYADIPLDGFTWDEPGKGLGDMAFYKAGAGFFDFFQARNGYDLKAKLICLDHLDGTAEAVKVRHDYCDSLVEMNYLAQKKHNDYARQRFGQDLIFGTHNTWSGYGPDLVAGVIDYFRLGKNLTAAWTDGGWQFELKYSLHYFMLAEGLKKELERRDAFYNDWGTVPVAGEELRLVSRLKMLFHINWFNHCISEFSEDLLNFALEPLKTVATEQAGNLDHFDGLVGDTFYPHTDVAMLYNWPTLAVYPRWLTRSFYTFTANASLHLVDRGLYAAIMSGEGLCSATITKGKCFTVNGLSYRVLVVPYAGAVPAKVYAKIKAIYQAGIPVVVVGPPPEFTVEAGQAIGADFARQVGMKPIPFAQYTKVFSRQGALPGIHEWEPSWIDVAYPVECTSAKPVMDREGRLAYVKAAKAPLYYMPGPDPREDLVNLLASLVRPPVDFFADDAYCRVFPHRKDPRQNVIVAVAKGHAASFGLTPDRYGGATHPPAKARHMKVVARLKGGELTLKGGTWAAVRVTGTRVEEILGDCPEVLWNGKRIEKSGRVR